VSDSLVAQVVARIRTWQSPVDRFSTIESVESVIVDGQEGLALLWTQTTFDQGVRQFGLLVTDAELAPYGGGVESIIAVLHLMVTEPLATEAENDERTWFRSMVGFSY